MARSSEGRTVKGALVQDPVTGYWGEAKAERAETETARTRRESRWCRYREALPETAGALVLSLYDAALSLRTGRREFHDLDLDLSTTDVAQLLLDGGRVSGYQDAESLAPVINDFLTGSGFPLRASPRKLGLGNQSPNRPDPRAQAQRRRR